MERINVRGIIAGGILAVFAFGKFMLDGVSDPVGLLMWVVPATALIAYDLIEPKLRRRAAAQRAMP